MVEKIEELVARQTEAIANLKIDKVTVWDSGNNGGGRSHLQLRLLAHREPASGS